MSQTDLEKITDRIDALCRERPSHKEVLEFLKQVATEQFRIKPEIEIYPVDIDEELLKKKTAEGFPVVDRADLKLDVGSTARLFERLCQVLKGNKKVCEDVEKVDQVIRRNELDLEELFSKTVAEDAQYLSSLSDRLNLRHELLFFLVQNSLQPVFEAYAEKLKEYVDQEQWWRGYCPVCGSKPIMAELVGAERKKFLICSCCAYEWRFMRTKCPYCEAAHPEKFKYFFTEKDGKAYRVETCGECKKYIKTVDTIELGGELIPVVEDIATLHLDILAKKEGFEREVYPLGLDLRDL